MICKHKSIKLNSSKYCYVSMKYPQKCGRLENSTIYCSDTEMPYKIKILKTDG